jgi:hypothetical protein
MLPRLNHIRTNIFAGFVVLLVGMTALVYFWSHQAAQAPPTREYLLSVANNPNQGRDARLDAVLGLFAYYTRVGSTSDDLQAILGSGEWLRESAFEGYIGCLSGDDDSVGFTPNTTLFSISLLPASRAPFCRIYFKLSGERSDKDARRFFRLDSEPDPKTYLAEWVSHDYRGGRVKIVDSTGRYPPK